MQSFIDQLAFSGITGPKLAIFLGISGFLIFFLFFLIIVILKAVLRRRYKGSRAFDLVVLNVQVPKFSAAESQQGSSDPKSQQELAERIAIMESIFTSIAGLRAERGMKSYFMGRSDHMSFEIV